METVRIQQNVCVTPRRVRIVSMSIVEMKCGRLLAVISAMIMVQSALASPAEVTSTRGNVSTTTEDASNTTTWTTPTTGTTTTTTTATTTTTTAKSSSNTTDDDVKPFDKIFFNLTSSSSVVTTDDCAKSNSTDQILRLKPNEEESADDQDPTEVNDHSGPDSTDDGKLDSASNGGTTAAKGRWRVADGGFGAVYKMAVYFLETVVQRRLLTELMGRIPTDGSETLSASLRRRWRLWSRYFGGFVAFAALATVLSLVVPTGGAAVAVRRLRRGRCGEAHAQTTTSGTCARSVRFVAGLMLFLLTCAVLTSVVCMAVFNGRFRYQLTASGGALNEIPRDIERVNEYLNATVGELYADILDAFVGVQRRLCAGLASMASGLTAHLLEASGADTALVDLQLFSERLDLIDSRLRSATGMQLQLDQLTATLGQRYRVLRDRVINDVSACRETACDDLRRRLHRVNITDVAVIGIQGARDVVGPLRKLARQIEATVLAETEKIAAPVLSRLTTEIGKFDEMMTQHQQTLRRLIDGVAEHVNDLQLSGVADYLRRQISTVAYPATVGYWCIFCLNIVLCFVAVCYLVGLSVGASCVRRQAPLDTWCVDRSAAADWLLTGACVSVVVYGVVALVFTGLFLVGGTTHTEVCRHLVHHRHPPSADVLRMFDRWLNASLYDRVQLDVRASVTYARCELNDSIARALDLTGNGYDVSHLADMSQYRRAIADLENLARLKINKNDNKAAALLESITPGMQLVDLVPKIAYQEALNDTATLTGVSEIADVLIELDNTSTVDNVYTNLTAIAEELRNMSIAGQSEILVMQRALVDAINDAIALTNDADSLINITREFVAAEGVIGRRGNEIAARHLAGGANNTLAHAQLALRTLVRVWEEETGRCRPVYDAISASVHAVCVDALYPLNGYWFSLGACALLLLPAIALSTALAAQYRKPLPYELPPLDECEDPAAGARAEIRVQKLQREKREYGADNAACRIDTEL